jgi:hypothetical protein
LPKCFISMEKRVSKATLATLFLSVLILAIIVMPVAKAANQYITLDPSQGPAGQTVWAYIHGFTEPYVNVTFGETSVGTAWIMGDVAHSIIIVPQVSPGVYTVTVRGSTGGASATFTVTEGPSPSPTPTEPPTGTPTGSNPTNPVTTKSGEFWSPLTIAIIASAVAACAFLITAVFMKRGKQNTPQYEETSHYEPRPSVPLRNPYAPSKINQPANTGLQAPFTKICRHCKQTIRDDYNVCPYCLKKLR